MAKNNTQSFFSLKISNLIIKYYIIRLLIYFYLFGGIFLKICHIPTQLTSGIQVIMDIIPFILFLFFNQKLNYRSQFINSIKFWKTILIIIILLFLANLRHYSNIIASIVHVGALIRFIPLSLLLLEILHNAILRKKFLRTIKHVTFIIICLSWMSILLGQNASILFPNLPEINTAERELAQGWHSAIYPNTIDLAFLLLILYIFWINNNSKSKLYYLTLFTIFGVPIFFTGSTISTLVFIFISFNQLIRPYQTIKWILFFIILIVLSIICYVYWDFLKIVIENAQLSRLGILTKTFPDFVRECSLDSWLGLGNDAHVVYSKINGYSDKVFLLYYNNDYDSLSGFDDVYWVALIVYHGVIGFILILYLGNMIYTSLMKLDYTGPFNYKLIVKSIFFTIIVLGFFNQILTVRTFSIVFWILIAYIYNNSKISQNVSLESVS